MGPSRDFCRTLHDRIKNFLDDAENLTHANVMVTFDDFKTAIANVKPSVSLQDLVYFEQLEKKACLTKYAGKNTHEKKT